MVTQRAAFNSPVWFNIGVPGVPQQASACFILKVDDEMDSILNWYVEEGTIFKGGSGAGINLSKIRSSKRSEEHTSELQSLMRISYAVFCLKKKKKKITETYVHIHNT